MTAALRLKSLNKLASARHDHARRGLYLGKQLADAADLHLSLDWLRTGLHVLGTTGVGKSRLLLWLFQNFLRVPKATVALLTAKQDLDPTADLYTMARNSAIAVGLTHRLVPLDFGDKERFFGYNPLQPNALPPATHAKAVRESIRAAWGQANFDISPQLARFLYLVLVAARELGWDLPRAAILLQPGSELRARALAELQDEFVVECLAYFDSLSRSRQDELAASTLARLHAFVFDPMFRRILTASPSLNLGDVLARHEILLVNLALYRPLRQDDVRLWGRLLLNDFLAHVFAREAHDQTPVYLICDEVAYFASVDLCHALDMGRGLGLNSILAHQRPAQLEHEDEHGAIWDAVSECARTKIVFGGSSIHTLERIVPELFLEDYDDREVKDELTTLELDPIESRRLVVTEGESGSESRGTGKTSSWAKTGGSSETDTRSFARTVGRAHARGQARMTADTLGSAHADSVGHASAVSSGVGSALHSGVGSSQAVLPNGDVVETIQESSGFGGSTFSGTTDIASESHTDIASMSHTEAMTESDTDTESESDTKGRSFAKGASESETIGGSGTTSQSASRGRSRSRSWVPFYEYRKRRNVSTRYFLTEREFIIRSMQRLKKLLTGQFVLKVPGWPAVFLQAPFAAAPRLSAGLLARALDRILARPFFFPTLPGAAVHPAPLLSTGCAANVPEAADQDFEQGETYGSDRRD